jgi:ATP-binding cassette subfamily F protein 3
VSERAGLTAGDRAVAAGKAAAIPGTDRKQQKRVEAEQRQARSREVRAQKQIVHDLERSIHELEARQTELAVILEKPETYEGGRAMEINRELLHVVDDLHARTAEWEAAATRLAELETPMEITTG